MKNKIKILVVITSILLTSGCAKTLTYKDENNKVINAVNPVTNQILYENILCKPTDESTINVYKEEKYKDLINIDNLPSCDEFNVTTGGYEGIWTTLFVKPLAWLIISLGKLVNSYGFALIIATILIRLVLYPFTKKQALQSENLKLAQPELNKLEKKYQNRQDQESMMAKSQEMMLIYKKYQINPLSGCLFAFLQIPLFFAFIESINRIPVIFEENFLGIFHLGISPFTAVTQGKLYYLVFIVLIAAATYYSFKLNSGASINPDQEKQMKGMTTFMIIFMTLASFSISTGIAIYWTVSNVFTIIQNLLVKRGKKNARNN